MSGDRARVTVFVAVPPAVAFDVFTQETDLWWRRGLPYRVSGRNANGTLAFEPRVGGRLFETFDSPAGPVLAVSGHITVWEPPSRLVFEWRAQNFAPGEKTEVEVRFEETSSGNTQVTLEHRGWAAIRPDHPARHGHDVRTFLHGLGLYWGALLRSLGEHAAD
jgi:uncharacterized protein YndB with AHSA1/START domain